MSILLFINNKIFPYILQINTCNLVFTRKLYIIKKGSDILKSTEKNLKITKGMKTKQKIYKTAIHLFEAHGIDNISINDIVKEVGIAKGSFYVHYESKFQLIKEYVSSLDLNYEEYFKSIPENTSASSMLLLVTEKTAEVLINDIGYDILKNIYKSMLSQEIDSNIILNYNRSLPQIYTRIILKGIEQKEFKASLNVEYITRQLMISIRGIIFEWLLSYNKFDLKNEIINYFKFIIDGL